MPGYVFQHKCGATIYKIRRVADRDEPFEDYYECGGCGHRILEGDADVSARNHSVVAKITGTPEGLDCLGVYWLRKGREPCPNCGGDDPDDWKRIVCHSAKHIAKCDWAGKGNWLLLLAFLPLCL